MFDVEGTSRGIHISSRSYFPMFGFYGWKWFLRIVVLVHFSYLWIFLLYTLGLVRHLHHRHIFLDVCTFCGVSRSSCARFLSSPECHIWQRLSRSVQLHVQKAGVVIVRVWQYCVVLWGGDSHDWPGPLLCHGRENINRQVIYFVIRQDTGNCQRRVLALHLPFPIPWFTRVGLPKTLRRRNISGHATGGQPLQVCGVETKETLPPLCQESVPRENLCSACSKWYSRQTFLVKRQGFRQSWVPIWSPVTKFLSRAYARIRKDRCTSSTAQTQQEEGCEGECPMITFVMLPRVRLLSHQAWGSWLYTPSTPAHTSQFHSVRNALLDACVCVA